MNPTPPPFSGSVQPCEDLTHGVNKWMALLVVTIGAFMGNLDASIVNISLPAIAHAFGTSFNGSLEWVVIGYLIVIASVVPGALCLAGTRSDPMSGFARNMTHGRRNQCHSTHKLRQ